MKKFNLIFCLFISIISKSQIGFEEYYTTRQLTNLLQHATTEKDKLEAYALLAVHFKTSGKDSMARAYMDKTRSVTGENSAPKIKARLLWWENYYKGDTNKARKYIVYAHSNKLFEEEISGYVEIARHYIHINLDKAEQHILIAKKLLDEWKVDSVTKDSIKLQVFKQLSHVFIHKKDGIKIVNYLLPLQDYAKQDRNLMLKEEALIGLFEMYNEWPGQNKKGIQWLDQLYQLYKSVNNPNKRLYAAFSLFAQSVITGDSTKARLYDKETGRLWDSIGNYGGSIVWYYETKHYAKLITTKEYVELIDTDFKGRYKRPPGDNMMSKIWLYLEMKNFDSTRNYINAYKKQIGDADVNFNFAEAYYFKESKQFSLAIPLFLKLKARYKEVADLSQIQWLDKLLAESYAGNANYKSAYEMLDSAYKLKDSLETLEAKGEVSLIEMQKQIELQQAAFEDEQAKTLLKNRLRIYGFIAGLTVLLIVAFILWKNNLRKQKDKQKIEQAYKELQATQQQLIQSEKMASLGELTAGIAHEIQNPLNFVNNFSEVNKELIEEMKSELDSGNISEAKNIAKDIEDNEDKIIFHGKRADAIVKGMLQHSRSSSGQKEPTDINALCDEYLRLAYHGLRAKDKSFNATMKTDFDSSIGNVNIIPQDIGRVVLNLINNAFYAVDEKKKKMPLSPKGLLEDSSVIYEPVVTVRTKQLGSPLGDGGKIEIRVADNGAGIPQKVLDKIFQPFFTTKPTGQGTGLGLSLSYDIVKAHGGNLKVETKEGEGTIFTISLNTV
jgi:signal transduction histidine kinase